MHIIDLNNQTIEITNLDAAIAQTEAFKDYHLSGTPLLYAGQERQLYWADLHRKLLELKNTLKP